MATLAAAAISKITDTATVTLAKAAGVAAGFQTTGPSVTFDINYIPTIAVFRAWVVRTFRP